MSRELWLLRHGKSDQDAQMIDFERPLKKRGKLAAQRVGVWMKQQHLIPDVVLSSPAKRAYDTAKIVCAALGFDESVVHQDKRLYFQGVELLKVILSECSEQSGRVLLVGHNPDFEDLLFDLVGALSLPDTDKLLPTAALARLGMPDNWRHLTAGCAQLVSITYAKSLP